MKKILLTLATLISLNTYAGDTKITKGKIIYEGKEYQTYTSGDICMNFEVIGLLQLAPDDDSREKMLTILTCLHLYEINTGKKKESDCLIINDKQLKTLIGIMYDPVMLDKMELNAKLIYYKTKK